MTTMAATYDEAPPPHEPDEDEPEDTGSSGEDFGDGRYSQPLLLELPHPINWDQLSPEEAEQEWRCLNEWVNWLRRTYGLPAAIIPPLWHRHPELAWELSALHLHWLGAYDPEQHGSAPIGWHADFATARERLRDWVTISGSKLDRDRPTRQTVWPGEQSTAVIDERMTVDRDADFAQFVRDDISARRRLVSCGEK